MSGKPDIYSIGYGEETVRKATVRLGMIGAGGVAQAKHLPSINRLRAMWEPLEVVAVADPDERTGRKVAAQYGATWYANHEVMLDKERLDAVDITSPDTFHVGHATACLHAGKHVLVEKPIASDRAGAQEMCLLAESKDLVLMTAFCKRYAEPYDRAKKLLESGAIGRPAMIAAKMCQAWAGVGLLERQHCHIFDIIRYLMGDVAWVHAYGINIFRQNDYVVDNVVVNLRFTSGAIGTVFGNSTALSYKPWERLEVFGEYKWLAVEDQFRVILYDGEAEPAKVWEPTVSNTVVTDEEFGGYVGEIREFADAVRRRVTPRVNGWDGYRALELADAVKLSLAERREIELPLLPPNRAS
jgi:predicted dehydrogenase